MKPNQDLEQLLREMRVTTDPAADERILKDALAALEQQPNRLADRQTSPWRIVMNKQWTKLATAAAVIAIAVVSLTVFDHSTTTAYAIEQTLEANRALRYVHVRIEPAGTGLSEAWAQFDAEGMPLKLRLEFPQTEDGPKTTVWQADKAEVLFHAKNIHAIVNEPNMLAQLPEMLRLFDPRPKVEELLEARANGDMSVEVKMPAKAGEPIVLSITSGQNGERMQVFKVDPLTKFVLQIDKHEFKDGEYVLQSRFAYSEYNIEPDPAVFTLQPPPDVTRIDQTTQEVGVPREGRTDEDLAVEVARQFFEALIGEDYSTAGRIYEGIPGGKLRESLGRIRFLRIVSIGSPMPHPIPQTRFLRVPCEIEIEVGSSTQIKTFTPNIRGAYNQPDRWIIGGGI